MVSVRYYKIGAPYRAPIYRIYIKYKLLMAAVAAALFPGRAHTAIWTANAGFSFFLFSADISRCETDYQSHHSQNKNIRHKLTAFRSWPAGLSAGYLSDGSDKQQRPQKQRSSPYREGSPHPENLL